MLHCFCGDCLALVIFVQIVWFLMLQYRLFGSIASLKDCCIATQMKIVRHYWTADCFVACRYECFLRHTQLLVFVSLNTTLNAFFHLIMSLRGYQHNKVFRIFFVLDLMFCILARLTYIAFLSIVLFTFPCIYSFFINNVTQAIFSLYFYQVSVYFY